MTQHKDFLGRMLEVGDTVVLAVPHYKQLTKGTVTRFTKCFVFVHFPNPWPGAPVGGREIKQDSTQLVKIAGLDSEPTTFSELPKDSWARVMVDLVNVLGGDGASLCQWSDKVPSAIDTANEILRSVETLSGLKENTLRMCDVNRSVPAALSIGLEQAKRGNL
jgi:hypothetical protein